MNKIILTDIDETVLIFSSPFQKWAESKGYKCSQNLRDCLAYEDAMHLSHEEACDLVLEFENLPEFGELPPEPDALEILPKLYAEGWQFIGITAIPDSPETRMRRTKNLEDVFGFPWEDIHCVGLMKSKQDILKKYEPTFWIEDNFKHAANGADLGHTSLLLDRNYNQNNEHTGVTRVNNWFDIYEICNA